jgi:hypothetical protein
VEAGTKAQDQRGRRKEHVETYTNGLTLPGHIETLFKAEAPFEPVTNGHGFIGILLLDKMEDKIQCHLCGRWFKTLQPHLKSKHETTNDLYKQQFGLPLSFPLCSRGVSHARSKAALRPERLKQFASIRDRAPSHRILRARRKKGIIESEKYGRTSAAFLNKHGLCHGQILRRFLIVADTVGKEPSVSELQQHDSALWRAIGSRYRNLNTFRKKEGFTIVKRHPIQNEDSIIAAIRSKARLLRRAPTARDFFVGPPSITTIQRHFGSWNRALEMAGFHRTPHSHERRTQ